MPLKLFKWFLDAACFALLIGAFIFSANLAETSDTVHAVRLTLLCAVAAALTGIISHYVGCAVDICEDEQERKQEALRAPQKSNEITHCVHRDNRDLVYEVICVDHDEGLVHVTSPQFDGIEYKFPLADVVLF